MGARLDDDNGSGSGSAYVFVRIGSVWSQQAKLLPADGATYNEFGALVSMSGDTALVGAYLDDDNGSNSGSAYIFVRIGTVWSQQAKLLPADGAAGDEFGTSVSVSGDTALVGARLDDDNGSGSGSAYVFALALSPGDPCALGTDCASGFCTDGVCCSTACNAGPCDACSIATGAPVNGTCALLTGPACDDNNLCTQSDTCQAGTCTGQSPVVCPAPDACHTPGVCNASTGLCSNPSKPDGALCPDGICVTGACIIDSDGDGVFDTDDNCPTAPNTTQTNTDLPLPGGDLLGDACDADDDGDGVLDASDNCPHSPNPAQNDVCSCDNKPDGAACDDLDPCTVDDTCQPQGQQRTCLGGARFQCPDPFPKVCQLKVCDSQNGACISIYKLEGTPCPGGECIAGGCLPHDATGSGGPGAGGGDQGGGGGGGAGATGSTTATGSGGAGGEPPAASSADGGILRMYGNGCALARGAGPDREDTGAAWLLAASLLAARRRRARP